MTTLYFLFLASSRDLAALKLYQMSQYQICQMCFVSVFVKNRMWTQQHSSRSVQYFSSWVWVVWFVPLMSEVQRTSFHCWWKIETFWCWKSFEFQAPEICVIIGLKWLWREASLFRPRKSFSGSKEIILMTSWRKEQKNSALFQLKWNSQMGAKVIFTEARLQFPSQEILILQEKYFLPFVQCPEQLFDDCPENYSCSSLKGKQQRHRGQKDDDKLSG